MRLSISARTGRHIIHTTIPNVVTAIYTQPFRSGEEDLQFICAKARLSHLRNQFSFHAFYWTSAQWTAHHLICTARTKISKTRNNQHALQVNLRRTEKQSTVQGCNNQTLETLDFAFYIGSTSTFYISIISCSSMVRASHSSSESR